MTVVPYGPLARVCLATAETLRLIAKWHQQLVAARSVRNLSAQQGTRAVRFGGERAFSQMKAARWAAVILRERAGLPSCPPERAGKVRLEPKGA